MFRWWPHLLLHRTIHTEVLGSQHTSSPRSPRSRQNAFLELVVDFWVSLEKDFQQKGPLSHILGVPLVLPRSEAAGAGRTERCVGWGRFSHVVQRLERNDQWIRVGVGWGQVWASSPPRVPAGQTPRDFRFPMDTSPPTSLPKLVFPGLEH